MTLRQFLDSAARFRVPVDWTMIQLIFKGHVGYCTLAEVIRYANQQLEHCPEDLLPRMLIVADGREMDWQLLEEALRMLASEDLLDREHAARRCRAVILEILLEKTESRTEPLDAECLFSEYWTFHEFWTGFAELPGGIQAGFLQLPWSEEHLCRDAETMIRVQREWLKGEREALGLPPIAPDTERNGCATS